MLCFYLTINLYMFMHAGTDRLKVLRFLLKFEEERKNNIFHQEDALLKDYR